MFPYMAKENLKCEHFKDLEWEDYPELSEWV